MLTYVKRTGLLIIVLSTLTGCAVIPVVALGNLMHKSGTMTITLEGQNAISAFRRAAIAEGGTVPVASSDYARAEFSDTNIKIDAQRSGSTITLRSSSLSNVGRTYDTEDSITLVVEAVAKNMEGRGLKIMSSDRKRL